MRRNFESLLRTGVHGRVTAPGSPSTITISGLRFLHGFGKALHNGRGASHQSGVGTLRGPRWRHCEMSRTGHAKVVIIGSGPAGYTAAIYAARAMLEPVLIQGIQPDGQLTVTTDVENYPGFADVIQGPWLMEQMQKQAEHVGTRIVTDHVNKVALARRPFRLDCDSGDVYLTDALIIATGAQARWL